MRKHRKLSSSDEARLEKALIRLVGSTRRIRRAKNLLEISKEVSVAEKLLGSRKIVAQTIGISEEMLREFASINKLCKSVKRMIEDGRLTSIDVGYRLSFLPKTGQLKVAKAYVDNELSTKDVRDVVSWYRKNPKSEIQDAIDRIKESKDIVQYVIKFRIAKKQRIRVLRRRLSKLLGEENLVSFKVSGQIANLVVNEKGRRTLQEEAKKRRITKRKLIKLVMNRE